jgi:hypothetical protein
MTDDKTAENKRHDGRRPGRSGDFRPARKPGAISRPPAKAKFTGDCEELADFNNNNNNDNNQQRNMRRSQTYPWEKVEKEVNKGSN